jgi:hypothetical protein
MKNILLQIILEYTSYDRGVYVGKALFFLALAGLGIYILIRRNKKKKK